MALATRGFVILCVYITVAAASFNGFFDKWSFRDDYAKASLPAMLDGTALRPFVYRQLVPLVANAIGDAVPVRIQNRWLVSLGRLRLEKASSLVPQAYHFRYDVVYVLTFVLFLMALLIARDICIKLQAGEVGASVAPLLFALFLPIIEARGGYFYDFSELFFLMLAVRLCISGWFLALVPLSIVATLNKEAFFFFVPTLYPIFEKMVAPRRALLIIGASTMVCGLTYLAVRSGYAMNPGDTARWHAPENVIFYGNPFNLFTIDVTYGMVLFHAYSIGSLILLVVIWLSGWRRAPDSIRRHVKLAAIVNVPLLVLFCGPGEMRNLSLMSVGLIVVLSFALARWQADRSARESPSVQA